jgi:hypothetical protein
MEPIEEQVGFEKAVNALSESILQRAEATS